MGVSYHGIGHMIYVIQLLLEVNHVVPLVICLLVQVYNKWYLARRAVANFSVFVFI